MVTTLVVGFVVLWGLIMLQSLEFHSRDQESNLKPFLVGAIQINPRIYLKDRNVRRLADRVVEAAEQGSKVIVAPEMATTGLLYRDRDDIAPFVEPIPGPTTEIFAGIAAKYRCYVALGMPEVDPNTGLFYNSMALVGPQGLVGCYRKTHLWETDAHWSAWGNFGVPVFETEFGRIAMLVCQDGNYIETFRLAMLGGADLVCFATNSSGQTIAHLQARALQNSLYIISANRSNDEIDARSGTPFAKKGCSAIWSPTGEKLVEAGKNTEETVTALLDPAHFGQKPQWIEQRQPENYRDLVRHIAPWNVVATDRSRKVRAIALQYEPIPGDVTNNLEAVEEMVAQSINEDPPNSGEATLVVLPELSFTGPVSTDTAPHHAERLDGRTVRYVARLAQRYRATIVFGMIEESTEGLYNVAALVGPKGDFIGRARKVHLDPQERAWALPGERFRVFTTTDLGRIGLLVGADAYYPESGAILGIERADLVAVSSSWHGEVAGDGAIQMDPEVHPHASLGGMVLWDDLASSNYFYVVAANFVGTDRGYLGRSGIYSLDPIYGIVSPAIACTNCAEIISGRFRTLHNGVKKHWIDQQRYIGSRRPDDLYHEIIRKAQHRDVEQVTYPIVEHQQRSRTIQEA